MVGSATSSALVVMVEAPSVQSLSRGVAFGQGMPGELALVQPERASARLRAGMAGEALIRARSSERQRLSVRITEKELTLLVFLLYY